jgi:hypothetical protein
MLLSNYQHPRLKHSNMATSDKSIEKEAKQQIKMR